MKNRRCCQFCCVSVLILDTGCSILDDGFSHKDTKTQSFFSHGLHGLTLLFRSGLVALLRVLSLVYSTQSILQTLFVRLTDVIVHRVAKRHATHFLSRAKYNGTKLVSVFPSLSSVFCCGLMSLVSEKFKLANSPWYLRAAVSYAFAASISEWKRPRQIFLPSTVMFALQDFVSLRQYTPLKREVRLVLNFRLLYIFCLRVASRRLERRLSRP